MTNPYGQQQPGYGQQPYGTPSGGMPSAPYGQPAPPSPPYGQPAPYGQQAPYGQPAPGGFGGPGDINAIKDYKGWAIGCIFLMWILAIFAIMKSNEVRTYKMQGNYMMAEQASNTTRTLCLIATIIGALGWAFAIIMIIISIVAAASVSTYCSGYYC